MNTEEEVLHPQDERRQESAFGRQIPTVGICVWSFVRFRRVLDCVGLAAAQPTEAHARVGHIMKCVRRINQHQSTPTKRTDAWTHRISAVPTVLLEINPRLSFN